MPTINENLDALNANLEALQSLINSEITDITPNTVNVGKTADMVSSTFTQYNTLHRTLQTLMQNTYTVVKKFTDSIEILEENTVEAFDGSASEELNITSESGSTTPHGGGGRSFE